MLNFAFRCLHGRWSVVIVGLCILATGVNASPGSHRGPRSSNNDQDRIIGGDQADVGEYPYFVRTNGRKINKACGGVLIASEWVLTALHCYDFTGDEVIVGAYELSSLSNGAKSRTCEIYKRDPAFIFDESYSDCTLEDPCAPFIYDYALCKLDSPVHVDDREVSLRLNSIEDFPSAGTDVVVIGLGVLEEPYPYIDPDFLQDVTVQVVSNQDCATAEKSFIYSERSITSAIICAAVEGGGKDSCQGDSGGPLVKKETIDGKRVDTHVGQVSWGVGCAQPSAPGVYARTSSSFDFIRKTICDDFESRSPFCQTPPPDCACNEQTLVIRVVPDLFPTEISWSLFRNGQIEIEADDYDQEYFTYEKSHCLEIGSTYNFAINDTGDNGLLGGEGGFYSLSLDGNEIKRASDYEGQDVVEIPNIVAPTEPCPSEAPTPTPTLESPKKKKNKKNKKNRNKRKRDDAVQRDYDRDHDSRSTDG